MTDQAQISGNHFTRLVGLEQAVRQAPTSAALYFTIVNETRQLVPYHQAALLILRGHRLRAVALSDIPSVDRNAPFVQRIEAAARALQKDGRSGDLHSMDSDSLNDPETAAGHNDYPGTPVWIPLVSVQSGQVGALIITLEAPPAKHQRVLLDHLAATFAHAMQVFRGAGRLKKLLPEKYRSLLAVLLLLLTVFVCGHQVPLTALAPAEIVPGRPFCVTAPLDGVVQKIEVTANQAVRTGDRLATLDDTKLRNQLKLEEKSLAVARAEYARARRGAFVDRQSQSVLDELQARVAQRHVAMLHARELLARTVLLADRAGVAVTPPPEAWEGRPVHVGETIMRIADPEQVEVRVLLPVKDAICLDTGSRVRLFLDSAPLDPRWATVVRFSYMPEKMPAGHFAYRVTARLKKQDHMPRIGLRGTAKIYGPRVSLFFYLFRRPLTYFRQVTGF